MKQAKTPPKSTKNPLTSSPNRKEGLAFICYSRDKKIEERNPSFPLLSSKSNLADKDCGKELNDENFPKPSNFILPRVSYAEYNVLLFGPSLSTAHTNPVGFITNLNFSSYTNPCVKVQAERPGNAFFITNRFLITCAHIVESKKQWSLDFSTAQDFSGEVPKTDFVALKDDAKIYFNDSLDKDEDLALLQTDFFNLNSVIVPQIPPVLEGGSKFNYNCAVISRVPYEISQELSVHAIKFNKSQNIRDYRDVRLKDDESEHNEIRNEIFDSLRKTFSYHRDLIVSYGATCNEWKYSERQDHICSTVEGMSGSVVRFFQPNNEQVIFTDTPLEESVKLKTKKKPTRIPIVHGVHTSGFTNTISTNSCTLTTSPKFIYLYCFAINKEYSYLLTFGLLPFPNKKHADLALEYLTQVLDINRNKKLEDLLELTISKLKLIISKY